MSAALPARGKASLRHRARRGRPSRTVGRVVEAGPVVVAPRADGSGTLGSTVGANAESDHPRALCGRVSSSPARFAGFGRGGMGDPVAERHAAERASRIAAAVGQRAALSNSSALSTTAATAVGASFATVDSSRAGFVAALPSSCEALSPGCTNSPASSENSVAPAAHRSVCASTSLALASACSGAMKAGVPIIVPVTVALAPPASSRRRAMPKSSTLTTPSEVMKRFGGLMSR